MKIPRRNVAIMTDKWTHTAVVSYEEGVFYVTLRQRNLYTNKTTAPRTYVLNAFKRLFADIISAEGDIRNEIGVPHPLK